MKKQFIYLLVCMLLPLFLVSCEKDKGKGGVPEENITRDAVMDADSNMYDVVKIGNQVWMTENLRTTKYEDGTPIPLDTVGVPSRYCPNGNAANVKKYGYLYNFRAVVNGAQGSETNPSGVQGICPQGWHVPSDAEWQELESYVRDHLDPNNENHLPAKALASSEGWQTSSRVGTPGNDPSSNNFMGFFALPAGKLQISIDEDQFYSYVGFGLAAYFWTCSGSGNAATMRSIHNDSQDIFSDTSSDGISVRCLKDPETED